MTIQQSESAERAVGPDTFDLSLKQQSELLELARAAVTCYLDSGQILAANTQDPVLRRRCGAFVTLRMRGNFSDLDCDGLQLPAEGHLRGCVGHVDADYPLYVMVQEMAVKAATRDPRFTPMILPDLEDVRIEISVMSPLETVEDVDDIEIGKHGLLIDCAGRRGVLLPKVPVSRDWSRGEFLQNLCIKAGLPLSAWQDLRSLRKFTTITFSEP